MLASTAHKAAFIALAAVATASLFATGGGHRESGPNDPIAADGSLQAGRAATIYNTNPLFYRPPWNSDDPADFEPIIKTERPFIERDRALFKRLRGRLDWSLCTGRDRQVLMAAVRTYYEERGRLLAEFSGRGPRARAAMAREYATPADREIDDYVRHAIQYGILHKADFSPRTYPEFAKTFADAEELGTGCRADSR